MKALRYSRLKKWDMNPPVYIYEVSGLTAYQKHRITKFLNRKTSPGLREYNRVWKAVTEIDEYEEELSGNPSKRREEKLKEKIEGQNQILQETLLKPARIGGAIRHRRLNMRLVLYFNRHGNRRT